ncbi:MAG: DUF2341 domain-containing protein [Candidatus Omnitrophica bacterium]|nr:DUF2341 domain-containing protein [Candidatus Omnitrophota bacterium]
MSRSAKIAAPFGLAMTTLFAMTVVCALLAMTAPPARAASWHHPDWSCRKKITIDNARVSGTSDLYSFPVMIEETDTDLRDKAQSGGQDILFTDATHRNKLMHEIESYSSSTGALLAWVKVPVLDCDDDTVIYMYYGNPDASDQQNVQETWDESFLFVHHLQETTTGATDFKDSTRNGHDSDSVTIDGTGSNPDAAGIGDGAIQLDGSNDGIQIDDHDDFTPAGDMTVEGWVRMDNLPITRASNADIVFKGHNGAPYQSYYVAMSKDYSNRPLFVYRNNSSDSVYAYGTAGTIAVDTWYYVAGVRDGDTTRVYLNGSDTDTSTGSTSGTCYPSDDDLWFGGASYTDGFLDELRFSTEARTEDWLSTTYNTINNNITAFYSKGTEESGPPWLTVTQTDTTIQIDVPNRYRAVLRTDDPLGSDEYLMFYDLYEDAANPDEVVRSVSPFIHEEGVTYSLANDDYRKTTVLEATPVRVRIRVEGHVSSSTNWQYVTDGTDAVSVLEEYTFTPEGVFVHSDYDFHSGITLDTAGGSDDFWWIPITVDPATVGVFETNLLSGNGAGETSRAPNTAFDPSEQYCVLQGTGGYQDVFVSLPLNRRFAPPTDSPMWQYTTSGENLRCYEYGTAGGILVDGRRTIDWCILLRPQTELDTFAERAGLLHDLTSPDALEFWQGAAWDELDDREELGAEVLFACDFEGADPDLSNGGDGWDDGNASGSATIVGNATAQVYSGAYSMKVTTDASQSSYVDKEGNMSTVYMRFYIYIDTETLSTGSTLYLVNLNDTSYTGDDTQLMIQQDAAGNLELKVKDDVDNYYAAGSDGYLNTRQWYCIEFKVVRDGSAGSVDLWVDGVNVLSQSGIDTGALDADHKYFGGTWSATAGNILYFDDVVVSASPIGPANINAGEGAYTAQFDSDELVMALEPVTAHGAPVCLCGFEGGDSDLTDGGDGWVGGWNTGSTIAGNETGTVHSGQYAVRMTQGGSAGTAVADYDWPGTYSELYVRFYYMLDYEGWSGENNGDVFMYLLDTSDGSNAGFGLVEKSGQNELLLETYNGGSWNAAGSDSVIEAGRWYCIEARVLRHATAGTVDMWLDGVLVYSATGLATGSTSDHDEIRLRMDSVNNQWFIDDLVVSESYIGPGVRHTPVYKVRGWRDSEMPQAFLVDGVEGALVDAKDYTVARKPVSAAFFADELLWASTLESSTAVTSPDVGSAGAVDAGVTYVAGRYGNGALFDANEEFRVNITGADAGNFNKAKGAIEFWYQPDYNHNDNTLHYLYLMYYDGSNSMRLYKQADNDLESWINSNATSVNTTITSSNYSWIADEWVHIRVEWDDTATASEQVRIFLNGQEPPHTDDTDDYNSANLTLDSAIHVSRAAGSPASGIIDEFRIYGGGNPSLEQVAEGGLEYASDLTWYSTLDSSGDVTSPEVGGAGTVTNATFVAGKVGNGALIDANGEYLQVPMLDHVGATTGTIDFWYKLTGTSNDYLTFFTTTEGDDQFDLQRGTADTYIVFAVNNATWSNWSSTEVNIFDGAWHHVRLTYDTDNNLNYLYLDGVNEGLQTTNHGSIDISSYNLRIGNKSDGTDPCLGVIDEFRVWDAVKGAPSAEYLNDTSRDLELAFEADDASNRGEYLFLGSDSKFTGLNTDLRTVGVTSSNTFSDGFESGNMSSWYETQTDSGDLSVTAAAAHTGDYGLQAVIDDTNNIWVKDEVPGATDWRARFWFHPNNLAMGDGDYFTILDVVEYNNPWDDAFLINMEYSAGFGHFLQVLDATGGSYTKYSSTVLLDMNQWHLIQLEWHAASASGANNGYFSFAVDGENAETVSGIDNDNVDVGYVILGAEGVDSSTSGTIFFDDYESSALGMGYEYWNGSAWSPLGVGESVFGTSLVTREGTFLWREPLDWSLYSVNGSSDLYYIRGRLRSGAYSTSPIENLLQTDILLIRQESDLDAPSVGRGDPHIYIGNPKYIRHGGFVPADGIKRPKQW